MPRIEELVDEVGNAEFINTLDLAKGYWQVPMHEERQPLQAPWSLSVHYYAIWTQWSTCHIQRMMDNILLGTESYAGVYLDDIVIHSSNWKDHIQHLTEG